VESYIDASERSDAQTSSSMRIVRLFSAAIALDPDAVAPERLGSEATYSPFDSETMPEYCFPAMVVEKLVSCICWAALLLALTPPPREAWLCSVRAGAGALGVEVLEDAAAGVGGAVLVDFAAALIGAAITGLKSVLLVVLDVIGVIVIALSSGEKTLPHSSIGGRGKIIRLGVNSHGSLLRSSVLGCRFSLFRHSGSLGLFNS
jgi:hypothetical protein